MSLPDSQRDLPSVSIVIVTYNVREFLEQALESVERASGGLAVETFVVDNDSADGSFETLRDAVASAGWDQAGRVRVVDGHAILEPDRPQQRHDPDLNPDGGHSQAARTRRTASTTRASEGTYASSICQ